MRVVVASLVTALLIVVTGATPAGAEPSDGIRVEGSVTYEVQPREERVRVTIDVDLTNLRPDRGLTYYYFDQIGMPAAAEATNVSARRVGGGALAAGSEDTDDPAWQVLTVRLSPVLRYGRPQRLQITYDLPNLAPRSDGWTRATEAFATFLVVPYGDSGHADVRVVVPESYEEVHVGGTEMSYTKDGKSRVYSVTEIAEPQEWWAIVAARDGSLLEEREVEVGEHTAMLRYWPGDEKWADFAKEAVTSGIPQLEHLVGRPWPVEDEIAIVESGIPHAYGFGGWYDVSSDVIEVGDELDTQIMLHELSHAWFNDRLGPERWFGEGLAELYSYLALEQIEGEAPTAKEVPRDHPHAQPLVSWEHVVRDAPDEDEYGYPASWWVLQQIYDEIGQEPFAEALGAAFDSTIPYVGNAEPEIVRGIVDWRRTLDLFELVGGATTAAELYETYVIEQDDAQLLVDRAGAREAYDRLVSSADGWGAPYELREAMTYWRFDDVDGLVEAAERVLTLRDDVLGVVGDLDLTGLPALEEAYAGARPIAYAIAEAELYAEVSAVLSAAQDREEGMAGLLTRIGLLGADAEVRLVAAAKELEDGEVERAAAASGAVLADVEEAPLIGGIVVAEAAAGLVLFWPLRAWTKRRRSRQAVAVGSDPWPTDEPSSSLSVH